MDNVDYLSLTDTMPFGKYKGLTIRHILHEDPEYLLWVEDTYQDVKFTKDVIEEVELFMLDEQCPASGTYDEY
jgi:uncharacterized protein (DUF3820 family)